MSQKQLQSIVDTNHQNGNKIKQTCAQAINMSNTQWNIEYQESINYNGIWQSHC